jgi:hypothetical protein
MKLATDAIVKNLSELNWFGDIHHDRAFHYFYFPPNETGGIYGVKLNKRSGNITAVMYVAMWDIDIEFDDLFSNVSDEAADILIYNLDLFRGSVNE